MPACLTGTMLGQGQGVLIIDWLQTSATLVPGRLAANPFDLAPPGFGVAETVELKLLLRIPAIRRVWRQGTQHATARTGSDMPLFDQPHLRTAARTDKGDREAKNATADDVDIRSCHYRRNALECGSTYRSRHAS